MNFWNSFSLLSTGVSEFAGAVVLTFHEFQFSGVPLSHFSLYYTKLV